MKLRAIMCLMTYNNRSGCRYCLEHYLFRATVSKDYHNIQQGATSSHVSPFRPLDSGPGCDVRHVSVTESTNRDARAWARNGAREGAVVIADRQTAGRGRHGRTWASDPGQNLLFSVVLYPTEPVAAWGRYVMATGVAVCRAVNTAGVVPDAGLKWPNDIMIDGYKCGGILMEREPEVGALVLGIGLNVNQADFPDTLATPATSLLLATGRHTPREELFHAILRGMSDWLEAPDTLLVAAYTKHLVHMGQDLSIRSLDGHRFERGTCIGISADGGLVMSIDGQHRTFHAGDVTLRPL